MDDLRRTVTITPAPPSPMSAGGAGVGAIERSSITASGIAGSAQHRSSEQTTGTSGVATPPVIRRWWLAAAGLCVVNAALGVAQLQEHERWPFTRDATTDLVQDQVRPERVVPRQSSGFPHQETSRPATPSPAQPTKVPLAPAKPEPATAVGDRDPFELTALLTTDGYLKMFGEVPSNGDAAEVLRRAAARLPLGEEALLADVGLHSDASTDWADLVIPVGEPMVFSSGASQFGASFAATLDFVATLLTASPELRVQITGRASADGATSPNLILSADRVVAAVDHLVQAGVAEDQIVTVARGESDAHPTPSDESGPVAEVVDGLHRRVDIEILGLLGGD